MCVLYNSSYVHIYHIYYLCIYKHRLFVHLTEKSNMQIVSLYCKTVVIFIIKHWNFFAKMFLFKKPRDQSKGTGFKVQSFQTV